MVMCNYFSAPDDGTAVGVLEQPGGPDTANFDVVSLKGIDPVVVMAQLEAILTDSTYDEAIQRPRSGQLLSSPDAESAFIVSVSDTLQEALASASPGALVETAGPWSASDELQASGITSETAVQVLVLLSGLASRARLADRRMYCWWAL
ncbi:hypothetical protein [Streptomyces albipurpureus]|uniref:Uncharacterized protein n=1 Tax=Streptomyces albipurpureus TaxID=2897419 RepID=A0ABT0UMK6_9ACTN|nr:hypothetical protein [Streptomyces sp. CWNU-1]MCM2389685.1 hypothetical protein [Streptomyces sp. CWNU-1]